MIFGRGAWAGRALGAGAALVVVFMAGCPRPARTPPAAPSSPPSPSPAAAPPASLPREETPEAQARIFGAQIFRLPEPQNLDAFFTRLRRLGVNTLYVRAFQNPNDRFHGGAPPQAARTGVYFETKQAPVVANLLSDVVRRGKAHGFRVFAWMTSRGVGWNFSGKDELLEYVYDFTSGKTERGAGLDIFHPAVESYLVSLYRDLGKAGVDGVLFQDDLVLRHGVGFGPYAEAVFAERVGLPLRPHALYASVAWESGAPRPVYTDLFWTWARLKSERILSLTLRLREAVREGSPKAEAALNVYYDTALSPRNGLAWLSQDVEAWPDSPTEQFAVMAYHRQMMEEGNFSLDGALEKLRAMRRAMESRLPRRRLLWKIQTRDWTTRAPLPVGEIQKVAAVFHESHLVFAPIEEGEETFLERPPSP